MATFRQRKGRWQAIIRRKDLKATETFDRLTDAKSWARAKERDADLGHLPGKMTGTLGPVIDKYEKEIWPVKKWGATKASDLKILKRDLGPALLSDLNRMKTLAYIRKLGQGAGAIAPSTINTRMVYLREVLKTANELWELPVPLAEVDAAIAAARRQKLIGSSIARERRPTQGELDRIMALDRGRDALIDLAAIVRVLAVLPLRLSELTGLEWSDLNETRRTAIIRNRKHPDFRIKERNDQEVPLIAFAGVDTWDLIAGRPRYMDRPFPYKSSSVSTAFGMACLRLKIEDLHLHDLRAHAASGMLEGGIPIPQVALISGHRNWKVLQRNYARLDPMAVHRTFTASPSGTPAPTPPRKGGDDPA